MTVNTTNIKFSPTYAFSTSGPRNCYLYQATSGGTSFGSNIANSTAYDYFPNTPSINDAIYFGHRTGSNPQMILLKWRNLTFEVGTVLDGTPTLVWEYYNGSSWSTLTVTNGSAFKTSGTQIVSFKPPSDWIALDPVTGGTDTASNSGLYVRCRMSATTGVTEGGANATNVTRMGNNALTIVNNVGGTAITLKDCYDTAVNQSWDIDPSYQADASESNESFYFNCNIQVGGFSYEDVGSVSGYLDWKNSVVTLENDCRLDGAHNSNEIIGGTDAGSYDGAEYPTLRTNQSFVCRQQGYVRGAFKLYGFIWENNKAGAATPASGAAQQWELIQFGRTTSGANGAEFIGCKLLGFSSAEFQANTTDGVVKNCSVLNSGRMRPPTGATIEGITLIDCNEGLYVQTFNGNMTLVGLQFIDLLSFNLKTYAYNGVTTKVRNGIGLSYTSNTAVNWGGGSQTGVFWIQYSVDVNVTDQDGTAISGATVALVPDGADENDNNFSTTTNGSGDITSQWVTKDVFEYLTASTTTITNYDDFTLNVTATGYQDAAVIFSLSKPEVLKISLLPEVAGGGNLNLADDLVKV